MARQRGAVAIHVMGHTLVGQGIQVDYADFFLSFFELFSSGFWNPPTVYL